ncbi:MAG: tetratricopeptide repeat protein [Saprospirales bacterium]|nr:tetratricopeptide repeat protein [Saprospirales bacterium]
MPHFLLRIHLPLLPLLLLGSLPASRAQTGEPQTKRQTIWDTNEITDLLQQANAQTKDYRLDEALQTLAEAEQKVLAWPESLPNKRILQTIKKDIGHTRGLQGRYDLALEAYQQFHSTLPPPDTFMYLPQVSALQNIATCYYEKTDYQKALHIHWQALALLDRYGGPQRPGAADLYDNIYNNLGICYLGMSQTDSALVYFYKALKVTGSRYRPANIHFANNYHNLSAAYLAINRFDSAHYYAQRSLDLRVRHYGPEHVECSLGYKQLAWYYRAVGAYDSALVYQQKNLEYCLRYLGPEGFGTGSAYNDLAMAYHNKGDLYRALAYYHKAIAIHRLFLDGEHPSLATLYNNLGDAYSDLGDIGRALAYQEEALRIRLNRLGERSCGTAYSYHNLGSQYYFQGYHDPALEYLTKALDIFLEKLGEQHSDVAHTYIALGNCYSGKRDYTRAINYYQKAMAIFKQIYGAEHPLIATTLSNLSKVLYEAGEKTQAYSCLEQATGMRWKLLGADHPELVISLHSRGEFSRKDGQYAAAYQYFSAALETLHYCGPDSLAQAGYIPLLVQTLDYMAALQSEWSDQKGDPELLQNARRCYREALAALDYQSRQVSPGSRAGLATQAAGLCARAIHTNLRLTQVTTGSPHLLLEVFELAERSKAFLLYEAIRETQARQVAGIPDSLLEAEYQVRVDIAALEKDRWEGNRPDSTVAKANDAKLFELNRRFETLRERFAAEYPKYFATRYDLKTISLANVQQTLLQPGQTLLEYTVGDSSIFLFLVQPGHCEVHDIPKDFPLEQWVQDMTQNGIYGFYTLPDHLRTGEREQVSLEHYTTSAQLLYNKLLAPFRDKLTPELIIIPDGALGYLPFEALLSGAPGQVGVFTSYPFLVNDFQISHCYSATLLREMRDKNTGNFPKIDCSPWRLFPPMRCSCCTPRPTILPCATRWRPSGPAAMK